MARTDNFRAYGVLTKFLLFLGSLGLAAGSARGDAEKSYKVKTVSNIAYYEGEDSHRIKHRLDLYLPEGKKDFPVLFFVHGGAWRMGDKNQLGIYRAVGRCFASNGIGVVMTNYRLSPKYNHPCHIQDVARAFAWTCNNIKKHGGRPDQIFISGHSAGGHLVALLATNETFLKAEGFTFKAIRAAIPVSGVFDVTHGIMFHGIFSSNDETRKKASPVFCASKDSPPFLILYAENDLPSCGKKTAARLAGALKENKVPVEVIEFKKRNHLTILMDLWSSKKDTTKAILDFIQKSISQ